MTNTPPIPQVCPRCQAVNKPGAKFCSRCGTSLVHAPPEQPPPVPLNQATPQVPCPRCRHLNRASARFCQACGSALGAAKPARPSAAGISTWIRNHRRLAISLAVGFGVLNLLCIVSLVWGAFSLKRSLQDSYQTIATYVPLPTVRPDLVKTIQAVPTALATYGSLPTLLSTQGPLETLVATLIPGADLTIPHLTDEEEIEIGRQTSIEFEQSYRLSTDAASLDRITSIAGQILPHQPRANIPFTFKLLETDEINGFALPGGYIYITTGLLDFVADDDELAGIIAHEIAHVALRHGAQTIEALVATEAALDAIATREPDFDQIYRDKETQLAAQMAAQIAFTGWGREAELDADEYGTRYMAAAGYNPEAYITLLSRLGGLADAPSDPLARLLATHPPFDQRIARVEQTILTLP